MPKSAKFDENDTTGTATIHSVVNGINEALLKGYVESIEGENAKIEAIMEKARADCQPFVDEIKAIKKAAAENDIPKAPLSAKLRERALKRKADGCRTKLNEDQQSIFDEISAKLGDLPLFQHLDD
jgi:type IV secretory pathway VirJ component